MDSTRRTHPSFIVEGASPDSFRFTRESRYHYFTRWRDAEYSAGEYRGNPSDDGDCYLRFEGTDFIEVPPEACAALDSSITISFWLRGDDELQPQNDNLLEACENGARILNIHLPWGTGAVYWDAGGRLSGNNNRLAKGAAPGEYKGRWNHWAFTKDARSGWMRIYLNGELWHEAGNMHKPMIDINQLTIGANCNANGGWYAGCIDEFQIWSTALSGPLVAAWMHRPPGPDHPEYDDLLLYYSFNEVDHGLVPDGSPNEYHGRSFGQPQTMSYGLRGAADRKPAPGAALAVDSTQAPRVSVRLFKDEEQPGRQSGVLEVWPAVDKYFDGAGRQLEERPLEEAEVIHQREHAWYGEAFEEIERFELARFITPYGKGLDLGEDGFTWIAEVTEYAPLLAGSVDLEAGNGFELLDLRFAFIEGRPPREVLRLRNLWAGGNYSYGELADDGDLVSQVVPLDADASGRMIRSRISGHGHCGPRNCCEWDRKQHHLELNGIRRFSWEVWKDCGMNPLHPQGGTWQFDRAGWCPGTFVETEDHEITPFTLGDTLLAVDYAVQPYDPQSGERDGRFYIEHQLFEFGPIEREYDVELQDILAPSTRDEHRRLNPGSGRPLIRIRNLGSGTVESVKIRYGLTGAAPSVYCWEGRLAFRESALVELPRPDWSGMDGDAPFEAELRRPNGRRDENRRNNLLRSSVPESVVLPAEVVIHVRSPGLGRAAENRWLVLDAAGEVFAERNEFEDFALSRDTLRLAPGPWEFFFLDNAEDGMIRHWWLRGYAPDLIGENGELMILNLEGDTLANLGYDFAEQTALRFFVGEPR